MDALSIGIIIIATATALLFKFVLYKKICNWMDQDLIKGLAQGDTALQQFLTAHYQQLKASKIKRNVLHQRLTDLAQQFEQNR